MRRKSRRSACSAGLTGTRGQVDGRVEVEQVSAQRDTAPNETPTPATRWSTPRSTGTRSRPIPKLTLSLQRQQMFDVDARRHASDLKDYAPLAGRDIRLSARLGF